MMNTPQALKNVKLDIVHPDFEFMFGGTESKRAQSIVAGGESLNHKMGARPQLRRDNESLARKHTFILILCRAKIRKWKI